jgi:hypothetical protein
VVPALLQVSQSHGSISCQVLPAIDGDDGAGDAAHAVADQERSQSAHVVDVHQMVVRRNCCGGGEEFVEAVDPGGGSGADRTGRDRVCADAFRAQFGGGVADRAL